MRNFVVVLLIAMISAASSKPIEEQPVHSDQVYHLIYKRSISKQQLPDEITLNKQFFDNIFEATRISRDTNVADAVPTIALHDLISNVEHTLIHSAQNLAAYNLTANLTTTSPSDTDSSNISHIEKIVLPITIPTPGPIPSDEITTEAVNVDVTTVEDEDLIRDHRSNDEIDTEHKEVDFESVQPIENYNLGMLLPIALNPSHVLINDKEDHTDHTDSPVTEKQTMLTNLILQFSIQSMPHK